MGSESKQHSVCSKTADIIKRSNQILCKTSKSDPSTPYSFLEVLVSKYGRLEEQYQQPCWVTPVWYSLSCKYLKRLNINMRLLQLCAPGPTFSASFNGKYPRFCCLYYYTGARPKINLKILQSQHHNYSVFIWDVSNHCQYAAHSHLLVQP